MESWPCTEAGQTNESKMIPSLTNINHEEHVHLTSFNSQVIIQLFIIIEVIGNLNSYNIIKFAIYWEVQARVMKKSI